VNLTVPRTLVPYWTEATLSTDCNTCGRDVWIGERCVISGPTVHCYRCGESVAHYDDNDEKETTK
jgi:hypothetical protein